MPASRVFCKTRPKRTKRRAKRINNNNSNRNTASHVKFSWVQSSFGKMPCSAHSQSEYYYVYTVAVKARLRLACLDGKNTSQSRLGEQRAKANSAGVFRLLPLLLLALPLFLVLGSGLEPESLLFSQLVLVLIPCCPEGIIIMPFSFFPWKTVRYLAFVQFPSK